MNMKSLFHLSCLEKEKANRDCPTFGGDFCLTVPAPVPSSEVFLLSGCWGWLRARSTEEVSLCVGKFRLGAGPRAASRNASVVSSKVSGRTWSSGRLRQPVGREGSEETCLWHRRVGFWLRKGHNEIPNFFGIGFFGMKGNLSSGELEGGGSVGCSEGGQLSSPGSSGARRLSGCCLDTGDEPLSLPPRGLPPEPGFSPPAARPRAGGPRCGGRRRSPSPSPEPGSCPQRGRGAAPHLGPPRGRETGPGRGEGSRGEHGRWRRGPGALSGAMRGRLLARLRRRRLLRLLLALGALALGLWAAYLELLAAPGGGAAPDRSE